MNKLVYLEWNYKLLLLLELDMVFLYRLNGRLSLVKFIIFYYLIICFVINLY